MAINDIYAWLLRVDCLIKIVKNHCTATCGEKKILKKNTVATPSGRKKNHIYIKELGNRDFLT
jgi:hypothetical protein